ncbi:hypothetical protein B0H13DRAFT_2359395 [Mycena leptocephala]|nr:hypothetical protein B0H13DRAFT_2359395 [Mycena leptocephala]
MKPRTTFAPAFAYPQYIVPYCEEVPRVVAERGCTKRALLRIHKTESFLRESRHMNRIGILFMPRSVANPAASASLTARSSRMERS